MDPSYLLDNAGNMPPVVHIDTDAPLIDDIDGSVVTEELWGVYYKPDEFRRRAGWRDALGGGAARGRGRRRPVRRTEHGVRGDRGVRADVDVGLAHCHKRFEGKRPLYKKAPTGGIGAFTADSFPVFDRFVDNAYVIADSNHGYKMIGVGALVAEELQADRRPSSSRSGSPGSRRAACIRSATRPIPGAEPWPTGPQTRPRSEFDLPCTAGSRRSGSARRMPTDIPDAEELEIVGEPGQDPVAAFRKTLGMFATGVTVVTTHADDQVHGMTANAFMSVSLRPPLVTISVDRRARMHALLHEGRRYGIGVLADEQRTLSDRFAGRAAEDAAEVEFDLVHETPLVRGALAHIVARVVRSYWGGDHSLFLGQVEYARYGEGRPLLFHGGGTSTSSRARRCSRSCRPDPRRDHGGGGRAHLRTRRARRPGGRTRRRALRDPRGRGSDRAGWERPRVRPRGVLRRDRGAGRSAEERRRRGRVPPPMSDGFASGTPRALEREPRAAWAMLQVLAGRLREG